MAQAAVAAWSGLANGRIPVSMMAPIGGGQVMEPHAARQLLAAIADMNAHGYSAPIVEGYRDYATQVQLRNLYLSGKGNVAAVPGTSNHGTGSAVDLGGGMDSWSSSAQAYWQSIEAAYGFSSAQGRADGEAWHKVCVMWLDGITKTFTAATAATEDQGETDMNDFLCVANSGNGMIGKGQRFVQGADGHLRCLTDGEWAVRSHNYPNLQPAEWAGDQIVNLVNLVGLYEYTYDKNISGGVGRLTGRLIWTETEQRAFPKMSVA